MKRFQVVVAALVVLAASSVPTEAAPPGEPLQDRQWALDRIEAPAAWTVARGSGAVVAVVDTGVDRDHPEFDGGKLTSGASCVGAATVDDCSTRAGDWDEFDCGPSIPARDCAAGHGTHVAGIVAAPLDHAGVAGVAPEARIMPVKVLDQTGDGTNRDVAVGIRWAVEHGADVINLSLGGLPVVSQLASLGVLDREFQEAIEAAVAAGRIVVVAAGNDTFPVCSHKAFVGGAGLCVGATDRRDVNAFYSNFGGGLDLVAPGGSPTLLCGEFVLSTHLAGHAAPDCSFPVGYEALAGTSMAAPHVSGVAALLVGQGVRGSTAANRIKATVDDLGAPGYDPTYGAGRLNARRAVTDDRSYRYRIPGL